MREVGLLLGLSESLESLLVGGELLSDGLGLSGLELERLPAEGELGAVLGVELFEAGTVLEGRLQAASVLLVDDRQSPGDCLSHDLRLDGPQRLTGLQALFAQMPPPLLRLGPNRQFYQMVGGSRARGGGEEASEAPKQSAGSETKEFYLL